MNRTNLQYELTKEEKDRLLRYWSAYHIQMQSREKLSRKVATRLAFMKWNLNKFLVEEGLMTEEEAAYENDHSRLQGSPVP